MSEKKPVTLDDVWEDRFGNVRGTWVVLLVFTVATFVLLLLSTIAPDNTVLYLSAAVTFGGALISGVITVRHSSPLQLNENRILRYFVENERSSFELFQFMMKYRGLSEEGAAKFLYNHRYPVLRIETFQGTPVRGFLIHIHRFADRADFYLELNSALKDKRAWNDKSTIVICANDYQTVESYKSDYNVGLALKSL